MRRIASRVDEAHPDFEEIRRIETVIAALVGGLDRLRLEFPGAIRAVIDAIIDPVRTGRTRFDHLDNVEKTFIGLKVEHVLRDLLDVPKGLRDLIIDGMDVDVKNTVRDTWTIPPETYREEEPCILIASEEATNLCWLGIFFARDAYLAPGMNRDGKRSVSAFGFENIWWIIEAADYPRSRWLTLDMERFRELRKVRGGTRRACAFFRENPNIVVDRSVIQALLYDQKDYMKRLRANQGARDELRKEGIALLSGTYDAVILNQLGFGDIQEDEWIAVHPNDEAQRNILRRANAID